MSLAVRVVVGIILFALGGLAGRTLRNQRQELREADRIVEAERASRRGETNEGDR